MSGGGGGSSRKSRDKSAKRRQAGAAKASKGHGQGNGEPEDPCDLSFIVDLTSINSQVLATVKVGDVLQVSLTPVGQYQAVVCSVPASGSVLGTLAAFPDLATLINCIRQGNAYIAAIRTIARGQCTVAVRRR